MSITQRALINTNLEENSLNVIDKTLSKSNRNYGIDLLRVFSMINIINLHLNTKAGLIKLNSNNIKFKVIWRIETFSYFGANCFGLISGIVGFNKYKFSNLIYLWVITAFYQVSEASYLFYLNKINLTKLFLSFFPIMTKYHWYVNSYFIMYLFLPFINSGIKLLNVETFRILVFFYICFFSIYYLISALFTNKDYTFLRGGYSSSWLAILYIIGSYFGKFKLNSVNRPNNYIKSLHLINYTGFSLLNSEVFFKTGKTFLINYLSPTVLFQALSLVIIFHSINIKNKHIIKIIKFINPLIFSVTFIHLILFSIKHKIVISFFDEIRRFNNKYLFFKIYIASIKNH